jgi:hypothetical protein
MYVREREREKERESVCVKVPKRKCLEAISQSSKLPHKCLASKIYLIQINKINPQIYRNRLIVIPPKSKTPPQLLASKSQYFEVFKVRPYLENTGFGASILLN